MEGVADPFPMGWAPHPHHLGVPNLDSSERTPSSALPFLPGLGGGVGDTGPWVQRPCFWAPGWNGWGGCHWQCQGLGPYRGGDPPPPRQALASGSRKGPKGR